MRLVLTFGILNMLILEFNNNNNEIIIVFLLYIPKCIRNHFTEKLIYISVIFFQYTIEAILYHCFAIAIEEIVVEIVDLVDQTEWFCFFFKFNN